MNEYGKELKRIDAINNKMHSFIKLPWFLYLDDDYKKISDKAKILYCLFLDKKSLSESSLENGDLSWQDEKDVFCYFTIEKIIEITGWSNQTISKCKKELREIGLIEEKRQLDKPNKIYIKKPCYYHTCEKQNYVSVKTTFTKVQKVESNKTDIINTNNNIYITDEQFEQFKSTYPKRSGNNWKQARNKLESLIKNGENFDDIIKGNIEYGKYLESTRNGNYVQSPQMVTTYLNQKTYYAYLKDDTDDNNVQIASKYKGL